MTTKTHPLLRARGAGLRLGATLFVLAACDGGGGVTEPGPEPTPEPRITAVAVSPNGQAVQAGATLQFQAAETMSDGSAGSAPLTWTATGGTVTQTGLFTAGSSAGSYSVTATAPNGVSGSATGTVTVTPAPPPPPPGNYRAVIGEDWRSYQSKDQLKSRNLFWWYRTGDVYQYVDLVPDAVFGQVARITFQQSGETGFAPKLDANFPAPLDRMWFRWRMRYSPGWTTVGPNPAGYANSYKVAFWLWEGWEGRGAVELSNTDEYILGFGVNRNGAYQQYSERQLPGSQSWGKVAAEWSDSQWYEFVVYYEKTGSTSARQHWWKRRLTSGGSVAPGPWTYIGIEVSGATTPQVRGITLGANKNKSNPSTMYIYWGPWEVVDGSVHRNPFGMAGF